MVSCRALDLEILLIDVIFPSDRAPRGRWSLISHVRQGLAVPEGYRQATECRRGGEHQRGLPHLSACTRRWRLRSGGLRGGSGIGNRHRNMDRGNTDPQTRIRTLKMPVLTPVLRFSKKRKGVAFSKKGKNSRLGYNFSNKSVFRINDTCALRKFRVHFIYRLRSRVQCRRTKDC